MQVRLGILLPGIVLLTIAFVVNGFTPINARVNHEDRVESVEVQLNVAGQIYEGLQERIEYSIGRVGEKILLDRSLSLLLSNQETVKTTIFNVFSKVLVGFKIEKVDLKVGNHTKVIIYLKPIPPLIQAVRLNIEVSGLAPELVFFTQEITAKVETELNHIFVGLPVESILWAEGIFNLVANYLLERELPGFNTKITLKTGVETVFNINLIPYGPVISDVKVDCSAVNIPVLFIKSKTNKYRNQLNLLKGLPVEFLSHYQLRLQEYFTARLNDSLKWDQTGMRVKLGIKPGVTTKVDVTVVSETFLVRFDTRYCMYDEESYWNFETYLGYHTEYYELFTRWYPFLNNPGGTIFVGCYFPLATNFSGGFEYEFEHSYKRIGFHFQFERGDYLELRLGIDGPTEGIIGIHINDQLNLELVDRDNTFGVQLKFIF